MGNRLYWRPRGIRELATTPQASVPSPTPCLTHLFLFLWKFGQCDGLAVFLRQFVAKADMCWVGVARATSLQLGASCFAFFLTWHILAAVKGSSLRLSVPCALSHLLTVATPQAPSEGVAQSLLSDHVGVPRLSIPEGLPPKPGCLSQQCAFCWVLPAVSWVCHM